MLEAAQRPTERLGRDPNDIKNEFMQHDRTSEITEKIPLLERHVWVARDQADEQPYAPSDRKQQIENNKAAKLEESSSTTRCGEGHDIIVVGRLWKCISFVGKNPH